MKAGVGLSNKRLCPDTWRPHTQCFCCMFSSWTPYYNNGVWGWNSTNMAFNHLQVIPGLCIILSLDLISFLWGFNLLLVFKFLKLFYCYIFEFVHLLQINESLRPRIICGSSSGLRTRWIMGLKEFGLLDTWRAHEGEFYIYFLLRFSLQFNYLVWITCW